MLYRALYYILNLEIKLQNDTGWWAAAVVDGDMYQIVGWASTVVNNTNVATLNAVEFTATRTSFSMTAGPMDINASFINPLEVRLYLVPEVYMSLTRSFKPSDLVRQSMPFTYFTMTAASNDGNAHDLRLYSDVALREYPLPESLNFTNA